MEYGSHRRPLCPDVRSRALPREGHNAGPTPRLAKITVLPWCFVARPGVSSQGHASPEKKGRPAAGEREWDGNPQSPEDGVPHIKTAGPGRPGGLWGHGRAQLLPSRSLNSSQPVSLCLRAPGPSRPDASLREAPARVTTSSASPLLPPAELSLQAGLAVQVGRSVSDRPWSLGGGP